METVTDLIFWAPKSLQMVTSAVKLKDTCPLELVKDPPVMQETWLDPWVGKIPRRRERLPTPIFWPGEFHGLNSP